MEGYVIKSANHLNGFRVVNHRPKMDEMQLHKAKIKIIKQLQFIFSNGTKSMDT